ncbi:CHAD domain-containing protein [candidate division KSB1 bacterium]|nr:CHAD domain-containing protein [candidate division KSB1 bacterium]
MTLSKIFKEEFEKLYSSIEKFYRLTIQGFKPEDIHNLRVTIKRLRAFFYLIKSINPDFKIKKHFRPVRKLFKNAGKIRDIQVQIDLASTWRTEIEAEINPYLDVLAKKETRTKTEFLQFTENFNLKKIFQKHKKVSNVLEKIALKKAEKRAYKYLIRMFTQIINSGNMTNLDSEALHRLRILTKEFRYNLEFITICLPQLTFPDRLIIELQKVHHILGLINDHNVAHQFFSHIPIEQLSGNKLEPIYQKIEKEKLILHEDFMAQWIEFKRLFPDTSFLLLKHH